jgi:hypothetical protein
VRRRPRWRTRVFLLVAGLLGRCMDVAALARAVRRGPWRVAVDETSMAPALLSGDWLLVDPTCRRWPRRGTLVVVREPGSGLLVVKRVAARRGDRIPGTGAMLRAEEAWLLGDARDRSVDSRRYGSVSADALVGRAWFRYGPPRRLGLLEASAGRRGRGRARSAD